MSDSNQSGLSDNALGALAYFSFVPAFFFLAVAPYNRKPIVRFHAWQSLILDVFVAIIWWLLGFGPEIFALNGTALLIYEWARIAFLVAVALLLIGLILSALSGKSAKLPLLGAWSERQSNR